MRYNNRQNKNYKNNYSVYNAHAFSPFSSVTAACELIPNAL